MRLFARDGRKKVAIVGALTISTVVVWLLMAGPMLIDVPLGHHARARLFNPIRDRTPERYAQAILSGLHSERCEQEAAQLQMAGQMRRATCDKQQRDPVVSGCSLMERADTPRSVWILFHCPYSRPTEARAEVALIFEQKDGQWRLRSYERIY
jgi:hypothetical protein